MALKWHAEAWRKVYLSKPPSWLRLSVSARGLGLLLLTYCDDAGAIDVGQDDPCEAIPFLLGARPKEHKRIAEDVAALLADGYLVHAQGSGAVIIRNFGEAQDRTPAAKRTADWRARKNAEYAERTRIGVTRDVTCDVTSMSRETSPETSPERHPGDEEVCAIRSGSEIDQEIPPVVPPPWGPAPARSRRKAKSGEPTRDTRSPGDASPAVVEAWLAQWNIPPVSDPTWGPTVQDFLDRAEAKGSAYTKWGAAWRISARKAVGWGHCSGDPDRCMRSDCETLFSASGHGGGYDRPPPPPNARLEAAKARLEADGWTPPPMPTADDAGAALLALVTNGAA